MAIEVTAHITGVVFKVEKSAGDTVEEGEEVIILESMKMEMPVESPASGKVIEIKVSEGDSVNEGQVVALIEEG